MLILALAAVAAIVTLSVRWQLRQSGYWRNPRPYPYAADGALAVLAIALAAPTYFRHREEQRLGGVASTLVGTHVTVHCQTFGQTFTHLGGELGFVKYGSDGVPERHTEIERSTCGNLRHYLRGSKVQPSLDQVIAVHVLTHESMHMKGQKSEALAECEAMQRDAQTARLLGADTASADQLARRYWLAVYPRMGDDYRSSECAPGGTLDEHLADPPWPTASDAGIAPAG